MEGIANPADSNTGAESTTSRWSDVDIEMLEREFYGTPERNMTEPNLGTEAGNKGQLPTPESIKGVENKTGLSASRSIAKSDSLAM